MAAIKMYTFGPKEMRVKTRAVGRSTTGVALAKIPRGSRLIGLVLTGTPSNSATSASLSFGTTAANANELVSAYDVKTAASGRGPSLLPSAGDASFGNLLSADTVIYYKYAETGAATVGSWNVHILYTDGETTR